MATTLGSKSEDEEKEQDLQESHPKDSPETSSDHVDDTERAARTLQKLWRARMSSRLQPDSEARWKDMATQIRYQVGSDAADQGENSSRQRWNRAAFLASRLGDGQAVPETHTGGTTGNSSVPPMKQYKSKGARNPALARACRRFYFRAWKDADTTENFFHWLDKGGGKDLDLPDCPRTELDSERITYLSAEQRLNYLCIVDDKGLLRWARNNVLVDTTPNRWKDSEGSMGIVPLDGTEDRQVQHRLKRQISTLSGSPSTDSSSDNELEMAQHYVGEPTNSRFKQVFTSLFTTRGLTERLLRRTVKKNTWIYVADMKFNVFIGIKTTGTFQHSSFTAGGLISSAGLIKVKNGQIRSLSPLSGHYRTSIDHFRGFLEVLESRGADLHKVKRTKAEFALWSLEKYKGAQKTTKEQLASTKEGIQAIPDSLGSHRHSSHQEHDSGSQQLEDANAGVDVAVDEKDREDDEWAARTPSWKRDVLMGRVKAAVHKLSPRQPESEGEQTQKEHVEPPADDHDSRKSTGEPSQPETVLREHKDEHEGSSSPPLTSLEGSAQLHSLSNSSRQHSSIGDGPIP